MVTSKDEELVSCFKSLESLQHQKSTWKLDRSQTPRTQCTVVIPSIHDDDFIKYMGPKGFKLQTSGNGW